MATFCIQCALEAYVSSKGDLSTIRAAALFNETPDAHRRRVHPDLVATTKRRRELEKAFARLQGKTMIFPEDN